VLVVALMALGLCLFAAGVLGIWATAARRSATHHHHVEPPDPVD
jgi:hypothetical protein